MASWAIDPNAIYTVEDTAEALGIHPQTIRRWIASRRLKARRMGGRYLMTGRGLLAAVEGARDVERDVERDLEPEPEPNPRAAEIAGRLRGGAANGSEGRDANGHV